MRRRALAALLLAAGTAHAAGPDELGTGAGWEVARPPASAVPLRGPRFARVTLEIWVALGNGQSLAAAALARRAVIDAESHDVRELVHLTEQGPPGTDLAAEAALEAATEGRFFEFLDRALADRALALTPTDLLRAGREAGLDGEQLAEALDTRRHRAAAGELDREARAIGHLPGELWLNGARVSPYLSEEQWQAQLGDARRRAQALIDEGVPLGRVYDQLLDAVADAQAPEGGPRRRLSLGALGNLSGAPARGPSLAPVTIVVFSNFFCASCGEAAQLVARLQAAHPGQVREVWKNFMSRTAVYSSERYAAEVATAAAEQGRFWELHDKIFASAAARRRMLHADIERLAREAGCDVPRIQREQREDVLSHTVDRELADGYKLGLTSAPSLVVNGILFGTLPSYERLERLVKAELGRGLLDRLQSP